ncbi:MAG: ATP-binding protein, partial [Sulfurimonas sp.]
FMSESEILDKFDVMIIDTGAGIGEHIQMFLEAADDVIVVTVPDPAAITDAYATIKTIATFRNNINLLLNQVRSEKEAVAIYEKINKVALANIGNQLDLKLIGKINSDIKVSSSIKRRALFSVLYPGSIVHKDILKIANKIKRNLEQGVLVTSAESGLSGLFKRLVKYF